MLTTTLRIWSVGPGIVSITLYFDFLRVYWITVLATETSWTFLLTLPTKYVPLSAWTPEMQSSTFTTSIHSLMISYKLLLRNSWYDKSLKNSGKKCVILFWLLCFVIGQKTRNTILAKHMQFRYQSWLAYTDFLVLQAVRLIQLSIPPAPDDVYLCPDWS